MVWIGALFLKLERNTSNNSRGDLLNNFFFRIDCINKKKKTLTYLNMKSCIENMNRTIGGGYAIDLYNQEECKWCYSFSKLENIKMNICIILVVVHALVSSFS